jgi:hypothetical protein
MSKADGEGTAPAATPGGAADLLAEARRRVRLEREKTLAEQAAFRRFSNRIENLAPATESLRNGPVTPAARTAGPRAAAVRSAYEETVMAVQHYAADFGEPYEVSVAREFGDDVATALLQVDRLPPALLVAVERAVEQSLDERDAFLSVVEREAESLAALETTLDRLRADCRSATEGAVEDWSAAELQRRWHSLEDLESSADEAVAARQETIARHRRTLSTVDVDVTAYFYDELSTRYPGLAALAAFRSRLEAARNAVLRALAGRD